MFAFWGGNPPLVDGCVGCLPTGLGVKGAGSENCGRRGGPLGCPRQTGGNHCYQVRVGQLSYDSKVLLEAQSSFKLHWFVCWRRYAMYNEDVTQSLHPSSIWYQSTIKLR